MKFAGILAVGLLAAGAAVERAEAATPLHDAALAADTTALQVGEGSFVFTGSPGSADKPVPVHYYRPASANADSPILFVMHGTLRNATTYRKAWIPLADKHGFILVVPEFSRELYPSRAYHNGNVRVDRAPVDSAQWTYVTIEGIFDEVKARAGSNRTTYHIYGHSAGGQFVHRMLWMMPNARIDNAVVANPGWYTLPNPASNWPTGVRGTASQTDPSDRLRAAAGRKVTILLGEADTSTTDRQLPKGRAAMRQGAHRFERGHYFFDYVKNAAEEQGAPFNWKLVTVPGVGHNNRRMAPAAAESIDW